MSKGNLFLGYGRGKVGDVVLYHQYGEQIARARNRHPNNPKTPLQLAQRVFQKTAAQAYSFFQALCNHSFQGFAEGTECQSRFMKQNIALIRMACKDDLAAGDDALMTSLRANYSFVNTVQAEINPYLISEGSLPAIDTDMSAQDDAAIALAMYSGLPSEGIPTYQQVCDAFGLLPGDQMTFVWAFCNDTTTDYQSQFNRLTFARVILKPASGDMSTPFLDANGMVNDPNAANEGVVHFSVSRATSARPYGGLFFSPANAAYHGIGTISYVMGSAVIASRFYNNRWLRSTSRMRIRLKAAGGGDDMQPHFEDTLGGAIQSYMYAPESSLYLNGGDRGTISGSTSGASGGSSSSGSYDPDEGID